MTTDPNWAATSDAYRILDADEVERLGTRFVRPDPFDFTDDMDGGAVVIVWMFAAIAVFAVFNIAAAVLCKLGWVG